jgi:hypothetical protein
MYVLLGANCNESSLLIILKGKKICVGTFVSRSLISTVTTELNYRSSQSAVCGQNYILLW